MKAVHIIETYFGAEDEADDENLAPAANGSTFAFGIHQKDLAEDECPTSGHHNSQPMATFNFAAI